MKTLKTLTPFIKYLEKTKPEDWAVDVVRTKDGRNCMFGHLVDWYYGKNYRDNVMDAWDLFEELWATTYMIYPVNDGNTPKWMNFKYEQPTAKERVIAYLKNLNQGLEKTTYQLMKEHEEKFVKVDKNMFKDMTFDVNVQASGIPKFCCEICGQRLYNPIETSVGTFCSEECRSEVVGNVFALSMGRIRTPWWED